MNILTQLTQILEEYKGEKFTLTPEMDLMKDIGLNSLDLIEMATIIEDTFHISISDRQIMSLSTVQDVIDLINKNIN